MLVSSNVGSGVANRRLCSSDVNVKCSSRLLLTYSRLKAAAPPRHQHASPTRQHVPFPVFVRTFYTLLFSATFIAKIGHLREEARVDTSQRNRNAMSYIAQNACLWYGNILLHYFPGNQLHDTCRPAYLKAPRLALRKDLSQYYHQDTV